LYVGVSGDIKLPREAPGANDKTSLRDLNLNSSRISPYGEVNLRKGDWSVAFRGFSYSLDQGTEMNGTGNVGDVDFGPGTRLDSSLDITCFEAEGGYRIIHREISPMTGGGYKLKSDLSAIVGLRVLDLNYSVENTGAGGTGFLVDSADEFTFHPLVGARIKLDFYEDFTIDMRVAGGALPLTESGSYGVDLVIGGEWRPFDHVGLQIGYRAMFFGTNSGSDNDEFKFDGSLQGLYAGVSFSF